MWTFDRFRAFEAIPTDLIDALGLPRIPPAGGQQSVTVWSPKINFPKHSLIQAMLTQHWSAKKCQDRVKAASQINYCDKNSWT